ncbi:uncharacterized protein EI90DRAFT_3126594 [Cantharellus anzutake]|uniref:uncharacterized protein n=1 Tax=Cantharellus anzutake TaxID=1750568 RepID=UPI001908E9F7|nr:uncharacterized protein EI90DRAFT_3126594 [Cantharellus anzutake]KAF8327945.1 hypothetical protein EI90DRAFT_3126594 [Cantharellus anzutake]
MSEELGHHSQNFSALEGVLTEHEELPVDIVTTRGAESTDLTGRGSGHQALASDPVPEVEHQLDPSGSTLNSHPVGNATDSGSFPAFPAEQFSSATHNVWLDEDESLPDQPTVVERPSVGSRL